jgi:hypothetical protein
MLIRAICFICIFAGVTPAYGAQAPWPSYILSGVEVRSLSAAFQSQYGRAPQSIEVGTVVHVVPAADGVLVRFEHAGGRIVSLGISHDGGVTRGDSASPVGAEVIMPGLDASAIAVAYQAWNSGAVSIPQSRADFDGDRFSVSERAIFDSALSHSRPGYYVTYSPPTISQASGSTQCQVFMNYRIDPTTWKVFGQPKIC